MPGILFCCGILRPCSVQPIHSHIRRLTSELNSPMPVIDIAHQHMLTARAEHISNTLQGTAKHETLDWSALVSGVRVTAGLPATGSGSVRHRQPTFTS